MIVFRSGGRRALVLDSSGEGIPHTKAWSGKLHGALDALSIPTGRVAYLTQDRRFPEAYGQWAAAFGVAPMTIINHDYHVRALFHPFAQSGEAEYAARLADYRNRRPQRSKRFVCLNFTLRESKLLFLLQLIRDDLWDRGHISFSGFDRAINDRAARREPMEERLADFAGFEDTASELLPYMDALEAKGCIMLGPVRRSAGVANHFKDLAVDMPLEHYGDAWFTVITETEMTGRRLTEKPFKAMLNFSPTLILGNAGEGALVRDMGFETFGDFIDESYDAEPDPRVRFEAVYAELRRLCALPEAEWARMERGMDEILAHNAHWGLTRMPGRYQEIDARLAERLLET
jgi:hypothetical protein